MPSPKRAPPKPKPRRRPGRPEGTGYHPTAEQRTIVEAMAGFGIPEVEMVKMILNPATKKPISPITLRKHFRHELDRGLTHANFKVIGAMFKNATTPTDTYPGGNPTSQIFWAKARLRWKDRDLHPGTLGAQTPATEDEADDMIVHGRRVAFVLAMAMRKKAAAPSPAPAAAKKSKVREPA